MNNFVSQPLQEENPVDNMGWGNWDEVSRQASLYDLIEIDRGVYQHWVMYLGEGNIVHVTQVDGRTVGEEAEKRIDKFQTIARDCKCRVNNHEEAAVSKGLRSRSVDEITESIKDVIKKDARNYQIVPYTVSSTNCEYYATSWKYGQGFSLQIEQSHFLKNAPPEVVSAAMASLQDFNDNENADDREN